MGKIINFINRCQECIYYDKYNKSCLNENYRKSVNTKVVQLKICPYFNEREIKHD